MELAGVRECSRACQSGDDGTHASARRRTAVSTEYYTTLHYTTLHYTTLHYTILYYTIYYTILNYTILYYTILYCTIRYYTVRQRTAASTAARVAMAPSSPSATRVAKNDTGVLREPGLGSFASQDFDICLRSVCGSLAEICGDCHFPS